MKLSVIVPVYNGEKYIQRCLQSICGQTFQDLEIVLINDGSTDKTDQVIRDFMTLSQEKRIRYFVQTNKGLPQTRKVGVGFANSPYIGFVDADDWIEPDFFAALMEQIGGDVDMVCAGFSEDCNGNSEVHCVRETRKMSAEDALLQIHLRKSVYQFAWNKIYKKSLFDYVNFPEGNVIGEDYCIVSQCLEHAQNVIVVPNCGYHYIKLSDSMSHVGYNKNFSDAVEMYIRRDGVLTRKYPALEIPIRNFMIQNYMGAIMAMCRNKTFDTKVIEFAHTVVKKGIRNFLCRSDFALYWKISVFLYFVSPKIFIKVFSLSLQKRN